MPTKSNPIAAWPLIPRPLTAHLPATMPRGKQQGNQAGPASKQRRPHSPALDGAWSCPSGSHRALVTRLSERRLCPSGRFTGTCFDAAIQDTNISVYNDILIIEHQTRPVKEPFAFGRQRPSLACARPVMIITGLINNSVSMRWGAAAGEAASSEVASRGTRAREELTHCALSL